MTQEQITKLKFLTMKPSIFSSFEEVARLRAEADSIRIGGSHWDGQEFVKTPNDKSYIEDLRNRADKMERELMIDLL